MAVLASPCSKVPTATLAALSPSDDALHAKHPELQDRNTNPKPYMIIQSTQYEAGNAKTPKLNRESRCSPKRKRICPAPQRGAPGLPVQTKQSLSSCALIQVAHLHACTTLEPATCDFCSDDWPHKLNRGSTDATSCVGIDSSSRWHFP